MNSITKAVTVAYGGDGGQCGRLGGRTGRSL